VASNAAPIRENPANPDAAGRERDNQAVCRTCNRAFAEKRRLSCVRKRIETECSTGCAILLNVNQVRARCRTQANIWRDATMTASGQSPEITPQLLLRAYAIGLFPMAEGADDPSLFWVDPDFRGVFPLDGLTISKSLAKRVRSDRFTVRVDCDFDAVIDACAQTGKGRHDTWINARIRTLYRQLYNMGFVHTIEAYASDGSLAGGLYGVSLGGAFFGESMFHRQTDASKVALVHLAARLRYAGFALLDTQFITPHLASLGAIEISRASYHAMLDAAIGANCDFCAWPTDRAMSGREALELALPSRDRRQGQ